MPSNLVGGAVFLNTRSAPKPLFVASATIWRRTCITNAGRLYFPIKFAVSITSDLGVIFARTRNRESRKLANNFMEDAYSVDFGL